MKSFFALYGRFVGRRPIIALLLVGLLSFLAIFGLTLTAEQADESEAFLPDGSELIAAQGKLARNFPASSGLEAVQIVFRGDVLTPAGLDDTRRLTAAAAAGDLAPFVTDVSPPTSPGHLMSVLLADGGDPAAVDLGATSQEEIDATLSAARLDPEAAALVGALDSLVARSGDLTIGGLGVVTVNNRFDPETLILAELAADRSTAEFELTTLDSARTVSPAKANQESDDSSQSSLVLLMGVAFLVIAALLALFYRQLSDVLLSLGGLVLTILWALGFQGLLGPDGLGVIGAPSVLGTMVPVMMIGLSVDYGIQGTSRYRESVAAGHDAAEGVTHAVTALMLPLGLAATTTIISFLTNLFGDISGLGDFGVVAGVGVGSGLFIFLTGVPAARVLLDARSQARGKVLTTKPMDEAIPGAGPLVGKIGAATVRRPAAILLTTGIITVVFATLALDLDSAFNSNDFLPDGSDTKEDIVFLQDSLGGNTEPVTVLVEADLSSDRTLRNLLDFSEAINDPARRPHAVSSPVTQSLGTFFESLPVDTLLEINRLFDGLDNPLVIPPEIVDESITLVQASDPEGFAAVVSLGEPGEKDFTILQFNAFTGDTERTRELFTQVDQLWFGDPTEITPIANEIISLEVTDSLTKSQGTSILLTILAALIVLIVFFWFTEFRPMLAVLSVFPILLVLVWVLGTMVLLGYSYNVVTALITALSIGIGVDYTIHITHRFLEEREQPGVTLQSAMQETMRTTGGALIGSALTTALGFAVLVFSPIPPMGQFGLLTAITVTYSLIAAIVVLPPMLVIWAAYHDWREKHFVHNGSGGHHPDG
jgi:uncharacterized protein